LQFVLPAALVRALALAVAIVLAAAPGLARADERPSDPWAAVPDVLEQPPDGGSTTFARASTAAAVGAFYGAFGTWAYFAWYWHQERNPEFLVGGDGTFGVNTYAGGADKLGHFWANLALTRLSYQILRAGHWHPTAAHAISFGWSAAFFFVVEVKDGYFYQFSWGDEIANLLGAGLAVALDSSPALDRLIDFRVEYWPSTEYRAILDGAEGADVNSANVAEDYSGQTYLLALHLGAVHGLGEGKYTRISRYIDAVVGYRTEHYKPDLNDPMFERGRPTQELSLGLSLNLQGVIDDALAGHGARRHLRAFGHALTEVFNPPVGSVRGNLAERDTDPDNVIPE
jgi:hypothetical protein